MKRSVLQSIALCIALVSAVPSLADSPEFSFGVIARQRTHSVDDAVLHSAINETDAENLAFVVVHGIKASNDACNDRVYLQQKALFENVRNGVVVSLAATDWAKCPVESSKSSAIGRLNRLRDLFFFDEFSLGESRIPVTRQSTIAKFRGFSENARWQIGNIMFATINLPSNNNNYVFDAGRNSEFEDRLIANRDWLSRVFTFARREKASGIVLFCDGNPLIATTTSTTQRDGYAETRKQIIALAGKFPGKVLILHGQPKRTSATAMINWQGNLGEFSPKTAWAKINVDHSQVSLFSLESHAPQAAVNR